MADQSTSQVGRWVAFALTLIVIGCLFLLAVRTLLPEKSLVKVSTYEPWSEEVLEAARGIPLQDGGRVKPLETYAGYKMLGMRGDRLGILGKDGEKVKITPTGWMLDALFRPEVAIKLPTFRIDNSDVVELIGMKPKAKRDRYTYDEVAVAREELFRLGGEYEKLQQGEVELDAVQKQTLALARGVREFESFLTYFSFARAGIELRGAGEEGASQYQRTSTVMATAEVIQQVLQEARDSGTAPSAHVQDILQQITDHSNAAKFGPSFLPPADAEQKEWATPGAKIWNVMTRESADPAGAVADIAGMENLVANATRPEGFGEKLMTWREGMEGRAEARGEGEWVGLELSYNKGNWFFRALFMAFLPAALCVVLSWVSPRSMWGRVMAGLVWAGTLSGLVMLVIGITQRSIVMQRPPVGNLYDTIPFITAAAMIVVLIVELITRRRLALLLAPLVGFAGLVMARLYEFGDPNDPMDPLLAVLRSNYWLTIHVLTITFGYGAGLVAAFFGHIYVFLRLFKLDGGDKALRRFLTRVTYGCICFTLLLSLVGTVLGGIWANDSWGRFWGWDPKENGALMIVLWTLFILHARMGGILREWGMNLCAIFLAVIVTFSWWHVNLLGVGLHSYGFSDSKKFAVFLFYGIEGVVLLFGIGYMLVERLGKKSGLSKAAVPGDGVKVEG